jgi:hypothetical protein
MTTQLVIVCADLPASGEGTMTVIGGTDELVILERTQSSLGQTNDRFACRRDTGEIVAIPESFVASQALPAAVAATGGRVALRPHPPAVLRGTERLAVAMPLNDRDSAALVPGVGAFTLQRSVEQFPRLVPTVVGAAGKLVSLNNLPVWVVNQVQKYDLEAAISWTIVYEPTARVVVIATPVRVSWITIEALSELTVAVGQSIEVVVARAPKHPEAIEYFRADRKLDRRDGADDVAATVFTPAIAQRIARLRELEVVPALSDEDAAELAVKLARELGDSPPADAGTIIAAYRAANGGPDYIAGPRSAATAARANAELARAGDPRRFVSFESFKSSLDSGSHAEPAFVRLSPDTRAAIVNDELLWLDPEPRPLPEVNGAASIATALVELGELAPASVVATSASDHVHLLLGLDAALDLIAVLPSKSDVDSRALSVVAPRVF